MYSVVGPGAVGGVIASALERSGKDVTVVARPASAERIARDGLIVVDPEGRHHTRPAVAEVPPKGSAVIVATKTYALADILPGIAAAEPSEALFLQNGVSHSRLVHSALANCERVTCGSIKIVATRGDDGVITQPFSLRSIEVPAVAAEWEITKALASAGVDTAVGGSESEVLWTKFRFLGALALATSWRDAPIGAAMDAEPGVIETMVAEIATIAEAEGLPTNPDAVVTLLRALDPGAPSSLWNDIKGGGPTEFDALGLHLVELARKHGIEAPTVTRAVDAIGARLNA